MITVIKRDGTAVEFHGQKIMDAVMAAGLDWSDADKFTHKIVYILGAEDDSEASIEMTVEYVQDIVIRELKTDYPEAAKRYEAYAEDRAIAREKSSEMFKGFMGIVGGQDKATLHENANKDSQLIPTMRDLIAGNLTKQYTLKHLFPKHVASAHNDGTIHIHDADYIGLPMVNCCLVNVEGMLRDGFKMGAADIETPKSILVAANVTAQIIAQVACNQFGGITVPNIDEVLEHYAALSWDKYYDLAMESEIPQKNASKFADKQTIKEIKAAAECIEYQINTMQTSNGQTPFTTITFGLTTSWFGREIQRAFLNQRIKGLGKNGITPVFPKMCFIRAEGINKTKDDPNYDIKQLAIKCSSKRLYPDWLDKEQLIKVTGGVPSPMGCRSFLPTHEDGYLGRMNLGVVTVNVPRCAIKAKGNMEDFWNHLDNAIYVAKEALDIRVNTCRQIKAKVAPILYLEGGYGLKADSPEELVFDRFFANNRASISLGYIGLYDTCVAMFGHGHHESKEAHDFAEEIVKYMAKVCAQWKEEENLAYSLYGTPSENLCGRFSELDKKMFGVIPNITDKGYHQNAFNIDVRAKIHPAEKIDLEQVFPTYASGGFISYGELPSMVNNLQGLEQIIDYALDHTPYYAVNVPADFCLNPKCKFEGEFRINDEGEFQCPRCGNHDQENMIVIRRVSGYLGSPNNRPFPAGKFKEMCIREKNR